LKPLFETQNSTDEDHDPDNPNHDVQILYHDTYYVTYVHCAEA